MMANMKLYRSIDGVILENEKVFKFLKISNTILHDINLYIKLFNPLIPEGIIISKIGLGSPLNEVSNLVLNIFAEIFCPNININLVTAASVDISFPSKKCFYVFCFFTFFNSFF